MGRRSGGPRLFFYEAGHVFADHIEFKVDAGTGDHGLNICVFEGVWDDGDVEFRLFYVEYGEAGAIDADRAFFYDEVAEVFGEFEAEFPAAVAFAAFQADGGGIYVSLYDVAVETSVHDQASFQVDEVTGFPDAKAGFFEGFFDGGDPV